MAPNPQKTINLAALSDGMPGLTPACGTSLAESAAVCLEDRQHEVGATLRLSGMKTAVFRIEWPPVDERQRLCYNDIQEATERGAYGVAILMVREVTGKVVVERSKKGPGFDYWIGDHDDDSLFSGKARLEVSGILSGTAAQIDARVRQKKAQISPSDYLAPGYVAVIEFGNPSAHVESSIEHGEFT
jgi:hypothetical protein